MAPVEELRGEELVALIEHVFQPSEGERRLAVLVDLPDNALPDTPAWAERRLMAAGWVQELCRMQSQSGLAAELVLYRNVRANNADLPGRAWVHPANAPLPKHADELEGGWIAMEEVLRRYPLMLAPTQLSATAPLKLAGKRHGFRAATMPGFSAGMIPALRLDYEVIHGRVMRVKSLLDRASEAKISFIVDGQREHRLELDLRHRTAHASGGLIRERGTAGNLPSGEAYIVPYEGELDADSSGSNGEMPVQFGDEIVLYSIANNHAVGVLTEGPRSSEERELLRRERGYGNIAELGFGVLAEFGVPPSGEILLDEKLGLHIAFGRSDHFGGHTGAAQFSCPEAVVHIDRVYIPAIQPRISVASLDLYFDDAPAMAIMRHDRYVLGFDGGGHGVDS